MIYSRTLVRSIIVFAFVLFGFILFGARNGSSVQAADCATIPLSGAWSVSSGCSLPNTKTTWGVDNGSITISTGQTLQILQTDKKLVWGPGASIVRNGTGAFSWANGAQITQKYMCYVDGDGDGHPTSITPTLQASSTCSGGVRPSSIQATYSNNSVSLVSSQIDLSDADASCYAANPCYSSFYPAFYPAFYPYQTFYPAFYPAFYPYQTFYPAFYPAFYPYQTFYPAFYPSFYPSFYPTFYPYQSFYPAFYPSFYPGFYPGFYPYQAFYPGFYPAAYGGFYPAFYPYQAFSPCFVAGTQVLMADGSTRSIENVNSGDKVQSYDFATGRLVENVVVEKYTHPENKSYLMINGRLGVTGNHRLWVNNREWKRADQIKIGDGLTDNNSVIVVVREIENVVDSGEVYNLHLASENHNYFANGILSHNGKQ